MNFLARGLPRAKTAALARLARYIGIVDASAREALIARLRKELR